MIGRVSVALPTTGFPRYGTSVGGPPARTTWLRIAKVVSSNSPAYSYLEQSIREWPDQGELSHWIRGVGFTRVAYRNLTAGVVALHRGRKPADAAVLASVAKRKKRTPSTPVQAPPASPQP